MSFLTRKKSAWDAIGSPPSCRFLTRKKWRDRATPPGVATASARGPVHPALGIFGLRKTLVSLPRAQVAGAQPNRRYQEQGEMAMPPQT
jgi:hypothetical protein